MKKNSSTGSGEILSGILFAVLGGILLIVSSENPIVISIAIADLLFGIVLILLGIAGKKKGGEAQGSNEDEPELDDDFDSAPQGGGFGYGEDDFSDIAEEANDLETQERQLRAERKQAVIEARRAQQEANEAAEISRRAEDELIEAEMDADSLSGDEQMKAMMRVDELATVTVKRSQAAAAAAKNAKLASKRAQDAVDAHNAVIERLSNEAPAAQGSGGSRLRRI